MALHPATKEFLMFLQKNPIIRARIKAPANTTMLYAGRFFKPIWQEIEIAKLTDPQVRSKALLPDVLARIEAPNHPHQSLLQWAKALDSYQPWRENGYVVWRALSGIFASNASGAVSFAIGSGVSKVDKVFAATELPVLMRNPKVDATTKDILAYYGRCIKSGQTAINFGFISS
jgi:hypothetical protein